MEQKEAIARANDLPVSWKNVVVVGDFIRGRNLGKAKSLLEDVIKKKVAVPFPCFNKDRGHKKGKMAAGKYPVKTAREVLNLLKSAESNAINMGMNASNLVVTKFIGNKGTTSWRFGRKRRREAKRAHIELFLAEIKKEEKRVRKRKENNIQQEKQENKIEAKK